MDVEKGRVLRLRTGRMLQWTPSVQWETRGSMHAQSTQALLQLSQSILLPADDRTTIIKLPRIQTCLPIKSFRPKALGNYLTSILLKFPRQSSL